MVARHACRGGDGTDRKARHAELLHALPAPSPSALFVQCQPKHGQHSCAELCHPPFLRARPSMALCFVPCRKPKHCPYRAVGRPKKPGTVPRSRHGTERESAHASFYGSKRLKKKPRKQGRAHCPVKTRRRLRTCTEIMHSPSLSLSLFGYAPQCSSPPASL